MKFLCDSCEKYPCDDSAIKLMKYCPVYSPKPKPFGNGIDVCPVCGKPSTIGKPQTNADRIRAMTDEELANMLMKPFGYACKEYCGEELNCKECVLEWLKKEVDND